MKLDYAVVFIVQLSCSLVATKISPNAHKLQLKFSSCTWVTVISPFSLGLQPRKKIQTHEFTSLYMPTYDELYMSFNLVLLESYVTIPD
jgi:hypothetical protein